MAISPVGLGPILLVEIVCKLIGANLVRLILRMRKRRVPAENGEA